MATGTEENDVAVGSNNRASSNCPVSSNLHPLVRAIMRESAMTGRSIAKESPIHSASGKELEIESCHLFQQDGYGIANLERDRDLKSTYSAIFRSSLKRTSFKRSNLPSTLDTLQHHCRKQSA